MSIKKTIIKVVFSNLVLLLSSIIIGFILPLHLSVEDYAQVKTYTLYMSFAGLLHMGYVDGVGIKYVKYRNKDDINRQIASDHLFFVLFQCIICISIFIVAILLDNILGMLLALSIAPYNISTFHKRLQQALGDFSSYSINTHLYAIINTALVLGGVYLTRSSRYVDYCFYYVVAYWVSCAIMEYKFYRIYSFSQGSFRKSSLSNIKNGSLILVGNLSSTIFFSLDRWFVKIFFSNFEFAYYSFAISLINIIVTIINAISVPFYNFLVTKIKKERYQHIEVLLLILGTSMTIVYFPIQYIITNYLMEYTNSLKIIQYSCLLFPFIAVINILYINLYKIENKSKQYVRSVVVQIFISIILNTIVLAKGDASKFALVTVISYAIWFSLCNKDFTYIRQSKKIVFFLVMYILVFVVCTRVQNILLASFLYVGFIVLIILLLYKNIILSCLGNVER